MKIDFTKEYSKKELDNIFKKCPIHNIKYNKKIDNIQYMVTCVKCKFSDEGHPLTQIKFLNFFNEPILSIFNTFLNYFTNHEYSFHSISIDGVFLDYYNSHTIIYDNDIEKIILLNKFVNNTVFDLTKFINFAKNKEKYIILL